MIRIDRIGVTEKENNILSINKCFDNSDENSTNEIMSST